MTEMILNQKKKNDHVVSNEELGTQRILSKHFESTLTGIPPYNRNHDPFIHPSPLPPLNVCSIPSNIDSKSASSSTPTPILALRSPKIRKIDGRTLIV
jgi:hypothetical protein